jgi:hypothetical protein
VGVCDTASGNCSNPPKPNVPTTPCGVGGASCISGQCVCPGATTLCSGSCVDATTDSANCGSCQHACSTTEVCSASTCKRYVSTTETVKDYKTNLVWQRGWSDKQYNWDDAGRYCFGLSLGGFASGWRLPSVAELESISDYSRQNPAIDTEAFPNTPSDRFWTSTPYAGYSGSAWYVHFAGGGSSGSAASYSYWVRCVR